MRQEWVGIFYNYKDAAGYSQTKPDNPKAVKRIENSICNCDFYRGNRLAIQVTATSIACFSFDFFVRQSPAAPLLQYTTQRVVRPCAFTHSL